MIDLHIHGAKGKDVMDGSLEAFSVISHALACEGVTGYLATTMTASNERIEKILALVPEAMKNPDGAAMLGIHLEGPFIAKDKMGAQSGDLTQHPDPELVKKWQSLAQDSIRLVTLAPELPGALELVKVLRDMDIIVAIGHTNATYAETTAAIHAGCTHATHLFNAMRGLHQREPGAAGALLLSEKVRAELIVDGLHLHPAIVQLALQMKSKDRLLLVTDAMRAKCLGDGEYELGGQAVTVRENKAALADGTLAGSTLRMPQAIKNMMAFTGCALAEAILMAAYNPAHALGLEDRKGSIDVGKDADLVVLGPELDVRLTMREGREIFRM
jgi:N-acetylglucosamine-6-phosphate deacetylase